MFLATEVTENTEKSFKMEEDKIIDGNCWVAYCDILGFRNEIKKFERAGVGYLHIYFENFYKKIQDELQRQSAYFPKDVFPAWFSDTFILFTKDDSKNSFGCLHCAFDIFCWMVISGGWPLRAAIGFGQLYADVSKNLFLGSGIINAHDYAEKQNWIGSIVTPEAKNRLNELKVDLSLSRRGQLTFTKYSVPFHQQEKGGQIFESELFVSNIHRYGPEVKEAIEIMQKESMNDKDYETKYKVKYENTLKFINENP